MKFVKALFLIPVVLILFIILLLFQVNIGIKYSLLSESYFNNQVDQVNLGAQLTKFLFQKANAVSVQDIVKDDKDTLTKEQEAKGEQMLQSYKSLIDTNLNEKWLEDQINVIVKGVFGYAVNDNNILPTIDIRPLKEFIPNIYTAQIIEHSDKTAAINSIKSLADKIDPILKNAAKANYSKQKIVEQVSNFNELKNLKLEGVVIEKLIDKIATSPRDDKSINDIYEFIVKEMIREKLNMDTVKDTLNTNDIVNKLYGDSVSPISEFRKLVNWYQEVFLVLLFLIVVLLSTIILCIPSKIDKGTSILAGIFIFSAAAVLTSVFYAKKHISMAIAGNNNPDFVFFKNLISNFIMGIFDIITIAALVTVVTGVIIIAAKWYLNKRVGKNSKEGSDVNVDISLNKPKFNRTLNKKARIVIIISSFLLIFASVNFTVKDFIYRVDSFKTAAKDPSGPSRNRNLLNIISESINAEFMIELGNKKSEE